MNIFKSGTSKRNAIRLVGRTLCGLNYKTFVIHCLQITIKMSSIKGILLGPLIGKTGLPRFFDIKRVDFDNLPGELSRNTWPEPQYVLLGPNVDIKRLLLSTLFNVFCNQYSEQRLKNHCGRPCRKQKSFSQS